MMMLPIRVDMMSNVSDWARRMKNVVPRESEASAAPYILGSVEPPLSGIQKKVRTHENACSCEYPNTPQSIAKESAIGSSTPVNAASVASGNEDRNKRASKSKPPAIRP